VCSLRERTYSVWAHMSKYITDFTNPFYKKDQDVSQSIVIPVTNSQSFKSVRSPSSLTDNSAELSVSVARITKKHSVEFYVKFRQNSEVLG